MLKIFFWSTTCFKSVFFHFHKYVNVVVSLLLLISNLILLSVTILCIKSIFLTLLRHNLWPNISLFWSIHHMHLRIMCLLLLNRVFNMWLLHLVGLLYRSSLHVLTYLLSHCSAHYREWEYLKYANIIEEQFIFPSNSTNFHFIYIDGLLLGE